MVNTFSLISRNSYNNLTILGITTKLLIGTRLNNRLGGDVKLGQLQLIFWGILSEQTIFKGEY